MHRPQRPFSEATALPADLRSHLTELRETTLRVVASQTASDGTVKSLMSAPDGASVEMVLMPYRDRTTICISSQVGCPVGCLFCATGGMGLQRNLTVGEIVDQVRYGSALVASEGRRITNVVYMGMGEPLLNLGAVLGSIQVITAPQGMGMAHRSLSVSSIGIPAGIRRLGREQPQVNLALSLHAADDETRARLVPEGYRHRLAEILDAAWDHFALTHRKLLVEYVLLGGVNDSPDDARRLATLLRGHVVTVNLLVWNPTSRSSKTAVGAHERSTRQSPVFRPSSAAAVAIFRSVLNTARVEAVLRQSRGTGIQAACGQLAGGLQSYQTKD